MARHRLINCEFLNARSFKGNVSNKAKLLYLSMLIDADDKGFVDTTQDLINSLKKNDDDFTKTENLSLLENTYETALDELIEKGYLYEFSDNHRNKVHLIRHWFYHNKLIKGLWTNYKDFSEKVSLNNNEYVLKGKKPLKEDNINQDIQNQDITSEEINKILDNKESEEEDDYINDLPFPIDPKSIKKGK